MSFLKSIPSKDHVTVGKKNVLHKTTTRHVKWNFTVFFLRVVVVVVLFFCLPENQPESQVTSLTKIWRSNSEPSIYGEFADS